MLVNKARSALATVADGTANQQTVQDMSELLTIKHGMNDIVGLRSLNKQTRLPNFDPTEIQPGGQQRSTMSTNADRGGVLSMLVADSW